MALVFNPLGGVAQLQITTAADLDDLEQLDKARWAATSVPTEQLACDPAFLAALDLDQNHRIRVDEVLAARAWLWNRLSDRTGVTERSSVLKLSHLSDHPEARKLHALATRLLVKLGRPGSDGISLDEVRHFRTSYAKTFPNGDGVVAAAQIDNPEVAGLIAEVVKVTGGTADLGGDLGAAGAHLDDLLARYEAARAWRAEGASVQPLGEATAAVAASLTALAPKVAQYFAQCRLVGTETGAVDRLKASPEELAALDVRDAGAIEAWLAAAPLATPRADGLLDLDSPLNPRFADALRAAVVAATPLVGGEVPRLLDADLWTRMLGGVQPFLAWQARRPEGVSDDLPDEHLVDRLEGTVVPALRELLAEDVGVADELQEFNSLEKLILLQRGFLDLCRNFVSFQQLFAEDERSLFEAGTLILDGRRLSLCMRVTDVAAHKKIAQNSGMFIAYAEITRKRADGTDEKAQIAAAVTAGTRGGIDVGKRGVFYDRFDQEWDAFLLDIVVQPISVWEAMIAPIQRLKDMIGDRLSKLVGGKAEELEKAATQKAGAPLPAGTPAPASTAPAAQQAGMQGLLVSGSLAFAAIGSSLAFVVSTLSSIRLVDALFGISLLVGGVMVVSGIVGWFRLRQRDLSTLLEASGWALNGRMHLTFRLGAQFSAQPGLPPGSKVRLTQEQIRNLWVTMLVVAALVGVGVLFIVNPVWLRILMPPLPELPTISAPATPAATPAAVPAAAPAPAPAAK